jgi:hypothetical protein
MAGLYIGFRVQANRLKDVVIQLYMLRNTKQGLEISQIVRDELEYALRVRGDWDAYEQEARRLLEMPPEGLTDEQAS